MTRPRFLSEDRICRGQPPSMAHVLGLLRKWVTVPDPVCQGEGGWPGGCCPSEYGSEEKGGLASPRFFWALMGQGPDLQAGLSLILMEVKLEAQCYVLGERIM